MKIANDAPHLSFRAKRGISLSITDHLNYEILRFAQDDHLYNFIPWVAGRSLLCLS